MIDVTASPLIELRDVTLEVEGHRFLDHASLQVEVGETLVVMGGPGCGKSFVLRLLLALPGMGDIPVKLRGEVIVAGQDVFALNGADLQRLRRRAGFVMQGGGLIENMDIRRNIALPIQYHFRDVLPDGGLADRRCDQLLQRFGLAQLGGAGLRPVALNHEQRIYVALARALVAEPFLLLMDDPASTLSPSAARRLCQHAFETPVFSDQLPGIESTVPTRLVVTADPARYLDVASRFVLLADGQLFSVGDRQALGVSTDPRLRALFDMQDRSVVTAHG